MSSWFAFVLAPAGEALIGQAPFGEIVLTTVVSALAVSALAVVTGRWMLGPAGPVVVNESMDAKLATDLTGVLLGNLPAMAQVHPEGKNITREKAEETDPVPLHPGAEQYYRDNP